MPSSVEHEYPIEFSAVITCYLEERSMREFHGRLRHALDRLGRSFEIVYVNDGSTDGTLQVLLEIYEQDPSVGIVIDLFKNSGSAAAAAAGSAAARGRHFIFIDSDLQLDPEDLPRLVTEFDKGADLANGVRRRRDDPWLRRVVSKVVNVSLRWLSGADVLDLGCTFKVAHGQLIRGLAPGPYQVLNPVYLAAAARDCANVPVAHHPRPYGSSGWTISAFLSLTADTVLGLTRHPFQVLGFVNAIVACAILSSIAVRLVTARAIFPAAITRLVPTLALLGLTAVFAVVCLVGEYVLRAHRSATGPPRYIIRSIRSRQPNWAARSCRQVG